MDSKTIKHIASLARIELTAREEEKISGELSAVLGYIDQLNSINTDGVEPLYQTTGLINSMRQDKSRKDFEMDPVRSSLAKVLRTRDSVASETSYGMDESLNEKLIGQAPSRQDRFIKVKSVLRKF